MEMVVNAKFLNGNYVVTSLGVGISNHFIEDIPLNIKGQRVARFILSFNKVKVATSGNILVTKTEMFEPCTLAKLQEASGLKERAFRTFKKELQEKDIIKIESGIIYVNPLFTMATDLDYIREDLISKFPKYRNYFDTINEDLQSE